MTSFAHTAASDFNNFSWETAMKKSKRRILFVCSANYDRSPTAEVAFKNVEGLEVKSAGASPWAVHPVNEELINWADEIYVMEHKHKDALAAMMPSCEQKIVVLDIPDDYRRGDPELVELLKKKMKPYLARDEE
jgi:predicted protein tyrosine phosphatase